ncbi:MAG: VWA domain-containing protein, partial [Spirochaetales bacterium]|nr:VWA domain-containing protein [Spirochaetales bacterium]
MKRTRTGRGPALLPLLLLLLTLGSCMGVEERYEEPVEPPASRDESSPSSGAEPAEPEAPETGTEEKGEESGIEYALGGARGDASAEDTVPAWTEETDAPAALGIMPSGKSKISAASGSASARPAAAQASGLKAGFADDNRQFNYFIQFLSEYGPGTGCIPIPIEERIILRVRDRDGKSVPNAEVRVYGAKGQELTWGRTFADGSFLIFPAEHGAEQSYAVEIIYNQQRQRMALDRFGRREVEVAFDAPRAQMSRIPLDLLFILDTTGSMGEEIQRLKTTIELINLNLSALSIRPRVRFGMVLYKDRGDEYVTRVVPFTEDIRAFQSSLDQVVASGGGDTPEDLQEALRRAMELSWNRDGVRLGFIITDAPPHLDYAQRYTYARAAAEAKGKAVKLFSVGTGGLDLLGEIVLRQIAQYTSAK